MSRPTPYALRLVLCAVCLYASLALASRAPDPRFPDAGIPPRLLRNLDFRETTIEHANRISHSAVAAPQSTDTVVRGDYLVNDDRVGNGTHQAAQCGFDPLGNCVVAWEDYRNGDGDALAQRFDDQGARVGGNFRACDDGDLWWQGEPAVGATGDGDYLVIWEDRRGGKSNVTAQRYVAGVPVDTSYRLNEDTPGDKRGVTVTTLPDGRYVVGWEDWRQSNGAIFAQVLDNSGQPIGNNFWVNFTGNWQAYGSSIGSDSLGNFALAWEDARSGWDVWAQRYDAQAQPRGTNFQVNSVTNRTYNLPTPALAMAPGGGFVVVWGDFREDSLHPNVYCQRYNAAGQALGGNFRVNDSFAGRSFGSPTVTCDQQGGFLVCWNDNRNGNNDIYAQAFDVNGERAAGNFRINDDAGTAGQGSPFVRFSPRREYWVFWTDAREGLRPSVYGQRLDSARAFLGGNFRVNDDSFASQQRVPTIAANDGGTNITIWEDERNGNCEVYCQLADSLGNPIGVNQKANSDNVGASHYYSTAAIDAAGNSVAAWTDGRSGYDIYAQAFNTTGGRVGDNFKVNDNTAAAMHWCPSSAKDSAGDCVVVFMDARQGSYDIYGQRYDAANQPKGANFRINDDAPGTWHQYPQVAMSRYGRFIAAWMEERDSGSVFCQVFDSAGNAVGANLRANDNAGSAYMGYPGVGCDPAGNFIVAWEDGRNPDETDIYAQRFDSAGNRLGANFRVNSDPAGSDQYSPSVGVDAQRRFIILWNDWRAPRHNPQIYVQRFYADGSRCGGEAIINEPDLFSYNHHWSMNHSVAPSWSRWYFTWTDNRRHQGFDTYNKITDWNLVGIADPTPSPRFLAPQLAIQPNPLVANGEVKLTVAESGPIRVRLYDAAGRVVRHLYSGIPGPGTLTLRLDARGLSQGAYFVTAAAGDRTVTKKIIVEGRP